jgi:nucleoside-diphosphate-sugar epimerase
MRVLVAGATGVIGRQLVPLLQSAGHEVSALARDPAKAPEGVEVVEGDALDPSSVARAVEAGRPEAIVHQLTALPAMSNPRRLRAQLKSTNRLRTEGTANLVEAAGGRPIVAQSVAFAYAPRGDRVVDEDTPLNLDCPRQFREGVAAIAAHEQQITGASGVVLRYGWLYGPGTAYARDGAYAALVRRRGFPIAGDGGGVFSFVHVRDAAEATVAALELQGPRTLNIVDDHPAPIREWLPEYARLLGAKPPRHVPLWLMRLAAGPLGVESMTEQRGASNARARAALGWEPAYPDWRGGFAEELA